MSHKQILIIRSLCVLLGFFILTSCGPSNYEQAECEFELSYGRKPACGWLTVPEDRSQEDGPTIRLHVGVVKTVNKDPAPDPIVILNGGPGVVSLDRMTDWYNTLGKQLRERDLIILDQRGTG